MSLLKINREALLKPLQAVSGIIERRHTLPILSNVMMTRQGNKIDFVATDIEIEISATATVDTEGDSRSITVGAKKLLDILKALPADSDVNLSLTDKRMQVKSGKVVSTCKHCQLMTFPDWQSQMPLQQNFLLRRSC